MITFEQWLKNNNLALPEATVSGPEEGKCPKCDEEDLEDGKCPICDVGAAPSLAGEEPGVKRRGKPGTEDRYPELQSKKLKKSKKSKK
jgi:hypothetical protein